MIVAGLVAYAGRGRTLASLMGGARAEVMTFTVRRGTLAVTVKEKGSLESAKNEDVMNLVEGQTTIISILPEGSRVTKGMLVCELDSAALNDSLNNQKITTERAHADYDNAKKTHEVAEIAVNEYVKGTYPQSLETYEGDIALAESTLERSKDRLEWSNKMLAKHYVTEAANMADKASKLNAEIALINARTKKRTLEEFTMAKEKTSLQADVAKALSDRKAKEAALDLETTKERRLERQIKNCKLYAPNDGLVVYANSAQGFGNTQVMIEEGATVRERQKIFSLPDVTHMRVNTKVHESKVDKIVRGLHARIRVDAFPAEQLEGRVEEVKPLPDATSFFASDVKQYTTLVAIEKGPTGLRPGMNAQVEVLIKQIDNALAIPVTAILQLQGKNHVMVMGPEEQVLRRPVTLGISDDKMIEIREGLKEGDRVVLNPVAMLTDDERREAYGSSAKGSAKGGGWAKGAPGLDAAPGAAAAAAPGAGGPPGAEGKAKGAGRRKGAGGGMGNLPPELQEKLKSASPEERRQIFQEYREAHPDAFPAGGGGGGGGGRGFGGGPGGGGGGGQGGGPTQ